MRIAAIFAVVGVLLISWATALSPYKDPRVVEDAVTMGPKDLKDSRVASEKYWAVRDSQLTWRFRLMDYGVTALSVAAFLVFLSLLSKAQHVHSFLAMKTPAKPWVVLAAAIAAVVTTTTANVASLFLGAARDEYPPWADSIGIPLMGTPVILLGLLVVAGLFYWVGSKEYSGGAPVLGAVKPKSFPHLVWLLVFGVPLVVSLAAVVSSVAFGDFLFVIPSALWAMFFLTLLAGKQGPANDFMHRTRKKRRLVFGHGLGRAGDDFVRIKDKRETECTHR